MLNKIKINNHLKHGSLKPLITPLIEGTSNDINNKAYTMMVEYLYFKFLLENTCGTNKQIIEPQYKHISFKV